MAAVLYQVVTVCALVALANACNTCSTNLCGSPYGRQVHTQEIYVQPGPEFVITPPTEACGTGVTPVGFSVTARCADAKPGQVCVSPTQEILTRRGDPNALMTLEMIVYCPESGSNEDCNHCPSIAPRSGSERRQPIRINRNIRRNQPRSRITPTRRIARRGRDISAEK